MPDSAVKNDSATPAREPAGADTEKKLARAARSAHRLAQLSEAQRTGETLDLFAEDAERANQQAMNTDIRQGTFAGFELPDVFMAAVQSKHGTSGDAKRQPPASAPVPPPVQDVLSLDDAAAPAPDDGPQLFATDASAPGRSPRAVAASFVTSDRIRTLPARPRADTPRELDRARAAAFTDTVDALHAVLVEQRAAAAVHARRMKTMLTIIVCAMLVTVATGIAQTAVLMRMRHDGAVQNDRLQQSMLNQQATLAMLFDPDSAPGSPAQAGGVRGTHRR